MKTQLKNKFKLQGGFLIKPLIACCILLLIQSSAMAQYVQLRYYENTFERWGTYPSSGDRSWGVTVHYFQDAACEIEIEEPYGISLNITAWEQADCGNPTEIGFAPGYGWTKSSLESMTAPGFLYTGWYPYNTYINWIELEPGTGYTVVPTQYEFGGPGYGVGKVCQ